MKINLILTYAGQTHTFTNLEFDDESLIDETYHIGRDTNNETFLDDFLCNFSVEVNRKEG